MKGNCVKIMFWLKWDLFFKNFCLWSTNSLKSTSTQRERGSTLMKYADVWDHSGQEMDNFQFQLGLKNLWNFSKTQSAFYLTELSAEMKTLALTQNRWGIFSQIELNIMLFWMTEEMFGAILLPGITQEIIFIFTKGKEQKILLKMLRIFLLLMKNPPSRKNLSNFTSIWENLTLRNLTLRFICLKEKTFFFFSLLIPSKRCINTSLSTWIKSKRGN